MRIFVAGATGAIGRRVVPQLVAMGHEVTAVGRTPEKRSQLARAGATPAEVDLFDPVELEAALADHDAVINLATHIPPSSRAFLPWAWRETAKLRRVASANLVYAALRNDVQRYIQESFAPVYADGGDEWIDESAPLKPAPHTRTVLDAEAAARRFTDAGRTGVVLRFAFFYGPDSGYTRDMVTYARKGWAAAFGSPDAWFSSVSHDDAAAATIAALGVPAGTYNVGDNEPLRRRDFYASLADALGVRRPRFASAWLGRLGSIPETLARSQRISNRRFRDASGWRPAAPSVRHAWPSVLAGMP